MLVEDDIKSIELSLESVREKDGKPVITVKSLTTDFEEPYVLEMLAKASIGKHYIWRHRHPIDPEHKENHIYGQVINSYVKDSLFSDIELYTHTNDHLGYIELIKEREKISKPLGLSMRYRKYYDDGKVKHVDVFEESGTPFPKCESCETIKFGVVSMTNEEKKEEEEDKMLEETRKKIKELEDMLNQKSENLKKYKCKIESLEKELLTKEETLEDNDTRIKKLEDTILEMGMEMEFLSSKKPLIDKILEVKELDENEMSFYKSQNVEYLESKLEQWTKEAEKKIVTQTITESANEALKDEKNEKKKYIVDGKEFSKEEAFKRFTSFIKPGGFELKK